MPAGNPVINTSSSFPSLRVGSRPPHSATAWHTRCRLTSDHEEDNGGADQRTTAGDSEAQTRATAGAPGRRRNAGAASTRSSDPPWPRRRDRSPSWRPSSSPTATPAAAPRSAAPTTPTLIGGADRAGTSPPTGSCPRSRRPPTSARTASTRRRRGGEQAEQAAPHRQGPDRPGRRSAPACRPTRATSGCSSTTPSRRARSTASPAWPSRATSTTPRATG